MIAYSRLATASTSSSARSSRPTPSLNSPFYDTQVELFMAITQMQRSFYIDNKGRLNSRSIQPQQIILYWKPPGAVEWVEKCRTEILEGKTNLRFTRKGYIRFDYRDMHCVELRFVIGDWSSVEVKLERLLTAGPSGYHIPLTLQLSPVTGSHVSPRLQTAIQHSMPGSIFLRAEVQQPAQKRFRVLCESNDEYFVELYKMNQGNIFDIYNAYTLLSRSEARPPGNFYAPVYFEESKICNGNYERVIKLEVYKKKSLVRKGFALTTLNSLLRAPEPEVIDALQMIVLPLDQIRIKTRRLIKIVLRIGKPIQFYPLEHYRSLGLKICRVYAVDYSSKTISEFNRTNWDRNLHRRRSVDDDEGGGFTTYEETLRLVAEVMMEFSVGDSMMYSFGEDRATFEARFPHEKHIISLLQAYEQASFSFRVSRARVGNDLDTIQEADQLTFTKTSFSSHAESGNPYHSNKKTTQLAPFLEELYDFASRRFAPTPNNFNLDYYTVFIFTNGEICDLERAKKVLGKLSVMPLSLMFIGVGLIDFKLLLELERYGTMATVAGNSSCRKFVTLVHFRTIHDWKKDLLHCNYCSDPLQVFRKEILTTLNEQVLHFVRTNLPH